MSFKIKPVTNNHYRSDIIRSVRGAEQIVVASEHQVAINEAQRILLEQDQPFHQMIAQVQKNHYLLRRSNEEKRFNLEALDITIRDFMVGLKRRARRNKYPDSFLVRYHLPGDQLTPKARPAQQNMSIAPHLIAGDKSSQAAGYEPMTNPSIQDLEIVLNKARKSCEEADNLFREYNQLRMKFAEVRDQTNQAINNLAAYLRIAYRSHNPIERRNMMRTLGFRYLNDVDNTAEQLQNEQSQPTETTPDMAPAVLPTAPDEQEEEKPKSEEQPLPSTVPVTVEKLDQDIQESSEPQQKPKDTQVHPDGGILVADVNWQKPTATPNNRQSPTGSSEPDLDRDGNSIKDRHKRPDPGRKPPESSSA